jgi:hypothetical protein
MEWVLGTVLPRLEQVQQACEATPTAKGVIDILDKERVSLRAAAAQVKPGPGLVVEWKTVADLAARPEMGAGGEGFLRVLYRIEREMADFRRGAPPIWSRSRMPGPASQVRAPACGSDAAAVLNQWLAVLMTRLEDWATVMLIHPLGRDWIDLLAGEPTGPEMFCIRASPKANPPANEIPYNLDAEFVGRARKYVEDAKKGGRLIMG